MYRRIFIYSALIFGFVGPCAADEPGAIASVTAQIQSSTNTGSDITASTESAIFPKLLWEKNLTRKLTSFAMSSDGTKIAIADETGYLTLYNRKGDKLWDYHYEGNLPKQVFNFAPDKNKANTVLTDVVFSSSGKYMVFEVSVLNTYKPCVEGPVEGCQVYRPYKKIFFDSEGNMLWQTSKRGMHDIGGDEYVLINPFNALSDDDDATHTYYLLDSKGQVLFSGNMTGMCEGGGFSGDSKYLYMCDKLIDLKNHQTVWKLSDKRMEFESVLEKFAILKIVGGNRSVIYDVSTRKPLAIKDLRWITKITDDYIFGRNQKGYGFYDIKTGRHLYTLVKGDMGAMVPVTEKYILAISNKGIQVCDMKGRKLWELPIQIRNGDEYELSAGYQSQKHSYYSFSKAGELVLFGQYKTVKLYKSF